MIAYSAIFLSGWKFQYPTPLEQTLWRIASLAMLAYTIPCGFVLLYLECKYFDDWKRRDGGSWVFRSHAWCCRLFRLSSSEILEDAEMYAEKRRRPWKMALPGLGLAYCTGICAVYCLARGYILVEDLVGLRSLPGSAFETVEWTEYLPQI